MRRGLDSEKVIENFLMNGLRVTVCIDDEVSVRKVPRLGKEVLSNPGMIRQGALFDPVFGTIDTGDRSFDRHVEDDCKVRPAVSDRDLSDGPDFIDGQPVSTKLVRECRGNETIRNDPSSCFQSRLNDLFHHLCTGGHVQQHFTPHGHFIVVGVQQNRTNQFSDTCGPGVANQDRIDLSPVQSLLKQPGLGRFATTLVPIKNDESCLLTVV